MGKFILNHSRLLVIVILLAKFSLGLFTMLGDSAVVDEIAHIPAGYSYVAYSDFRLNPEHPPLLKDLAGAPLLLTDVEFPKDHISWTEDVNGQWESGWHFLYHYGNNPDLVLFFSRLPLLLLSVLFGLMIYLFSKKFFGTSVALLATFFFALSPNFLGHSHLVTTDMGIAAFTFLALASLAYFLKYPSTRTFILATLALASAHITKFSSVTLVPFYFGIFAIACISAKEPLQVKLFELKSLKNKFWKKFLSFGLPYIFMMAGSMLVVWIFYIFHTLNFPQEKQAELIQTVTASYPDIVRNTLLTLSRTPFLKAITQYILGVTMVFGRVAGGNTTFFLGEVTNQSFKLYFPVSYLLKTPLSFLLFVALSSILLFRDAIQAKLKILSKKGPPKAKVKKFWVDIKTYAKNYLTEIIFFLFILYYALISITGNLNLGIRHLFPILPLIYVLVSKRSLRFLENFKTTSGKLLANGFLTVIVVWFALSSVLAFPSYISYYNEIIGGSGNAYLYFTDSNVDWGQDLKRFSNWLKDHPEIDKIKLDYFGGGEPKYYMCLRKFDETGKLIKNASGYNCDNSVYERYQVNDGPTKGWIAVSVTFLQNARWYHELYGQQDYDWLRDQEPYAKIGNSIFIYRIR